ncbi:MAG: hypothetical protein ACTSRA_13735 [Promethearchaeota archaeon]
MKTRRQFSGKFFNFTGIKDGNDTVGLSVIRGARCYHILAACHHIKVILKIIIDYIKSAMNN